jgi:serine/threonine protein kinase
MPSLRPGDPVAPHLTVVGALDAGGRDPVYIVWHRDAWCAMCCKLFERPAQARWEARALTRLAHPGIVRLLEDGAPRYLLTEFLEGPSLERLIRARPKGRLGRSDALRVAIHLGSALAHLHGRGLVHLDVKPANVVVTRRRPVLFDLGAARRLDGRALGTAQGTDAYMAPEQARGGVPTPASDVWGLGVTLFEMLTGSRPFPKGDEALATAAPRLAAVRSSVTTNRASSTWPS